MALSHKDINLLTQKATIAGTEKIPVSDTEYVTTTQIASLGGGGSSVTVDSTLSSTSENPVQNKVIYAEIGDIETIMGSAVPTDNPGAPDSPVRVKQNGAWVTANKVLVKQSGTWNEASKVLAKDNGTWK